MIFQKVKALPPTMVTNEADKKIIAHYVDKDCLLMIAMNEPVLEVDFVEFVEAATRRTYYGNS